MSNGYVLHILQWLGAFIIAVIIYFLGKSRGRQERINAEFNKEAKAFRDAFNDVIIQLENRESHVWDILSSDIMISQHKKAINKFILAIDGLKRNRFKRAYSNYESYCKKQQRFKLHNISQLQKTMQDFHEKQKITELKTQPNKKEINKALKHIYKMLSFAKTK